MAKDEAIERVRPKVLKEDRDNLDTIQGFGDYKPARQEFALSVLEADRAALDSASAAEVQAEGVWKGARDTLAAAEWKFHNDILGAKDQVTGQYGDNSNQIQALGLKKKSERKRPARKSAKAAKQ